MGINYLIKIADVLDNAIRMGANEDTPEGAQYIQISDTLAKQISENLRVMRMETNYD